MTTISDTFAWGYASALNAAEVTSVQLVNWTLKNSCISKANDFSFKANSTASLFQRIKNIALSAITGFALCLTTLPHICQSAYARMKGKVEVAPVKEPLRPEPVKPLVAKSETNNAPTNTMAISPDFELPPVQGTDQNEDRS